MVEVCLVLAPDLISRHRCTIGNTVSRSMPWHWLGWPFRPPRENRSLQFDRPEQNNTYVYISL